MLQVNYISIKLEQHKFTMRAELVLSTLTGCHFLKDSKIRISHNDAFCFVCLFTYYSELLYTYQCISFSELSDEIGTNINSILQKWKLRLTEVKFPWCLKYHDHATGLVTSSPILSVPLSTPHRSWWKMGQKMDNASNTGRVQNIFIVFVVSSYLNLWTFLCGNYIITLTLQIISKW